MAFPNTDFPTALDTAQSRVDLMSVVYDDDFNYHDEQIRTIQEYFGISAELIGQRIAGKGPGGMVSPVASGGGNRAFRLAARNAFAAGYVLSVGDNYDISYTEKLYLDYLGLLWTLGGIDASNKLVIPHSALPGAGTAGRLHWDPAVPGLKYDDGGVWNDVGGAQGVEQLDITAYSYLQTDPSIEETLNYGYFDGSAASNPVFWGILSPSISVPGTTYLRIYDVGPAAGPPAAPVLVAALSTATSGGPQYLEQALVIGAGPALNQIQNTARLYSVRVYQLSTNGDTVLVGAGGLADR